MTVKLSGSVAVVTGGGRGLGLAFVQVLVENGASVSLLDINEEVGMKAVGELENEHKAFGRILFVKCNVTDKNEFEDAFQKTVEKFGKINIVVNNAGIMTKYVEQWEQAIDINYKGVVRGTLLGLKYIENSVDENSAIINVGSIVGLSNSILPIYQSTKRAIIEFTKSIGCSYNMKANGNDVRIMAICPGPTFDGYENDIKARKILERKMQVLITNGEENPDPNRIISVQSTKYIKIAFLHALKNGRTGDVWITENEQPPRLSSKFSQF